MGPLVTILRLLLVVSGLAALGYAPSLARAPQAEAVTLAEARISPDAPSLRSPLPEQPKGDLPDLALPAAPVALTPPSSRALAVLLPAASLLPNRALHTARARAPPLA